MIIGLPKEIKNNEFRVGLTPSNVSDYVAAGHTVRVEAGAGLGSGYADAEYAQAGAVIVADSAAAWDAEMVVKVKEPVKSEYRYFREGMILYTYLHLADNEPLTMALMEKKVNAVAYETIVGRRGGLPCLAPMSHIAGRLSIQEGAKYLEKRFGGASDYNYKLFIAHTQNEAAAFALKNELALKYPEAEIYMDHLPLSISCHIGPGAIGVGCCRKFSV